jgi:anthranilate synthase component 2
MKVLVFDNYDSFTYNLVHLLEKIGGVDIDVRLNDRIALSEIENYDKILISPGPGLPSESGILPDLIKTYAATKSILGVCLGLQAIGESFGGTLENLKNVYHGIATPITIIKKDYLFNDCPAHFLAGRYHSWILSENDFPDELEITALDNDGRIMAIRHKEYDVRGIQFHPESILSEYGETIIRNWLGHKHKKHIYSNAEAEYTLN